jgi:hypothetical protein
VPFAYSETGFDIDTQIAYEPFMNDLGGTQIQFDDQNMGQQAFISGTITWWNEPVMAQMDLLRGTGNPVGFPTGTQWGTETFGAVGAFMGFEKRAFQLWLQYPYFAKPSFQNPLTGGPMEPGRRYPFSKLKINRETTGTRAKRRILGFHCLRQWNPTTQAFTLWDNFMGALPAGIPS